MNQPIVSSLVGIILYTLSLIGSIDLTKVLQWLTLNPTTQFKLKTQGGAYFISGFYFDRFNKYDDLVVKIKL